MSNPSDAAAVSPRIAGWLSWPVAAGLSLIAALIFLSSGIVGAALGALGDSVWQLFVVAIAAAVVLLGVRVYRSKGNAPLGLVMAGVAVVAAIVGIVNLFGAFLSIIGVLISVYIIGALGVALYRSARWVQTAWQTNTLTTKAGPTTVDSRKVLLWPVSLAGVNFSRS